MDLSAELRGARCVDGVVRRITRGVDAPMTPPYREGSGSGDDATTGAAGGNTSAVVVVGDHEKWLVEAKGRFNEATNGGVEDILRWASQTLLDLAQREAETREEADNNAAAEIHSAWTSNKDEFEEVDLAEASRGIYEARLKSMNTVLVRVNVEVVGDEGYHVLEGEGEVARTVDLEEAPSLMLASLDVVAGPDGKPIVEAVARTTGSDGCPGLRALVKEAALLAAFELGAAAVHVEVVAFLCASSYSDSNFDGFKREMKSAVEGALNVRIPYSNEDSLLFDLSKSAVTVDVAVLSGRVVGVGLRGVLPLLAWPRDKKVSNPGPARPAWLPAWRRAGGDMVESVAATNSGFLVTAGGQEVVWVVDTDPERLLPSAPGNYRTLFVSPWAVARM